MTRGIVHVREQRVAHLSYLPGKLRAIKCVCRLKGVVAASKN